MPEREQCLAEHIARGFWRAGSATAARRRLISGWLGGARVAAGWVSGQ